jgi:hypothetical protein
MSKFASHEVTTRANLACVNSEVGIFLDHKYPFPHHPPPFSLSTFTHPHFSSLPCYPSALLKIILNISSLACIFTGSQIYTRTSYFYLFCSIETKSELSQSLKHPSCQSPWVAVVAIRIVGNQVSPLTIAVTIAGEEAVAHGGYQGNNRVEAVVEAAE